MANEKWLIDANALLEKFQFRLPVDDHIAECIDECVKMARQIINDAPTVDAVEVVHGWWEWDTEDIYKCSNCGEKAHVKEVMGQPDWNYCPNCGAKMDGERKDHG